MCDCTEYKFYISIFWEFKSSRMLHCAVRVTISISKDCSAIIFRFKQSEKKYVHAGRSGYITWMKYMWVVGQCVPGKDRVSTMMINRQVDERVVGRYENICVVKSWHSCVNGDMARARNLVESHYFRSHKPYKYFFPAVLSTMISWALPVYGSPASEH